mmetsp:Transcript_23290/g.52531  ORF Transcript_23290/g.52531 Transcript_23290/m.52531 type:complete len:106 (+) Transcript_23290:247-564(+)
MLSISRIALLPPPPPPPWQHKDVQNLRDGFKSMKEEAHAADPTLKDAINRKGRSRSLMDEVKMRNLERAVRGEAGGTPTKTVHDLNKKALEKKHKRLKEKARRYI